MPRLQVAKQSCILRMRAKQTVGVQANSFVWADSVESFAKLAMNFCTAFAG